MGSIDRIFTDDLENLDVAAIMDITRKYWYPLDLEKIGQNSNSQSGRLAALIEDYQQNCLVNYWYPVSHSNSPGGRIKYVAKKALRKIMKPVLLPLINQQNDLNLKLAMLMKEIECKSE